MPATADPRIVTILWDRFTFAITGAFVSPRESHLNLSKGGVSASLRGRGMWYTVSRGGRMRTTIGIPRTGVYLTKVSRLPTKKGTSAAPAGRSLGAQILRGLLITFAIYAAIWLGVILLAAR